MGVLTTLLKLLKPGENDYYNQQTEQADNWQKVDDYAVLTNTDKNGIWGGEYGGKIQDPIPKELNKRYIDNINGKAFICIKAGDSSVTSNTTEYFTPCNVVDNLGKLQNLLKIATLQIGTQTLSSTAKLRNITVIEDKSGLIKMIGENIELNCKQAIVIFCATIQKTDASKRLEHDTIIGVGANTTIAAVGTNKQSGDIYEQDAVTVIAFVNNNFFLSSNLSNISSPVKYRGGVYSTATIIKIL